jgi:hypothetical protein
MATHEPLQQRGIKRAGALPGRARSTRRSVRSASDTARSRPTRAPISAPCPHACCSLGQLAVELQTSVSQRWWHEPSRHPEEAG